MGLVDTLTGFQQQYARCEISAEDWITELTQLIKQFDGPDTEHLLTTALLDAECAEWCDSEPNIVN